MFPGDMPKQKNIIEYLYDVQGETVLCEYESKSI